MLPGERAREYLTPDREPRAVCDLCRANAQRAGWVRADLAERRAPDPDPVGGSDERSWVLRRRPWRRGRERRRAADATHVDRAPRPRGRDSGGGPERRIRRALDRFNASEHRRTVEGLTRSLGEPRVAAIAPAEAPDQVRLTVAWSLSWYQWKVEFSGTDAAVRSSRTGTEIAELGAADRAWNARAGADGRLQLGLGTNGGGDAPAPDEPE